MKHKRIEIYPSICRRVGCAFMSLDSGRRFCGLWMNKIRFEKIDRYECYNVVPPNCEYLTEHVVSQEE